MKVADEKVKDKISINNILVPFFNCKMSEMSGQCYYLLVMHNYSIKLTEKIFPL